MGKCLQKKLAFSKKNRNSFWADVKRMNSTSTSAALTVDNVHDCGDIANVFAAYKIKDNFPRLYNIYIMHQSVRTHSLASPVILTRSQLYCYYMLNTPTTHD